MVCDAAQILDRAVIEEFHIHSPTASPIIFLRSPRSFAASFFTSHHFGLRCGRLTGHFGLGMRLGLVHQVRHPGCDRLDQHLCPFALEKFEHVEVAVAFSELRPEFARDLHHGLDFGAVHFNVSIFSRAAAKASR